MKRYRQTMTIVIDVLAEDERQATQIISDEYGDWDTATYWQPDSTVLVDSSDEDFFPINEEYN